MTKKYHRYRKRPSVVVPEKDLGIHEECGIFGIIGHDLQDYAREIYFALFSLQHRGQESAGMAVAYGANKISYYKNMGLVSEVFGEEELSMMPPTKLGIGHVRYSTTGSSNVVNAQPVVFYGKFGRMALAHNGNIVNADEIKSEMIKRGHIFQSSVDSEVIAAWVNDCIEDDVTEGIIKACRKMRGGYALLFIIDGKLYAVRDPYGIKPLVMGEKDGAIIFASESCALDAIDAAVIRDVNPGEIISVDSDGNINTEIFEERTPKPCIFEYVYLARSDSIMDSQSVYDARYMCGVYLARLLDIKADIVAGVPDSALVSARGFSEESGIPYVDAISKNRYIGRTFIQPSQSMRENSVKIKLNAFRSNIRGKKLILIDDSIVRGTTSKKIIQLLRQSGAAEVHMVVSSPKVTGPCFFGVDMQTKDQLIASGRTEEEICKLIGADSLHYLPLDRLIAACSAEGTMTHFCTGCFNEEYSFDIDNYHCEKFGLE